MVVKQVGDRETMIKHTDRCQSAALSPDGSQLVSASGEKIFVWDLATRAVKSELKSADVNGITYSDDGKFFALRA